MSTSKFTNQDSSIVGQASKQLLKVESQSVQAPNQLILALDPTAEAIVDPINKELMDEIAFLDLVPVNAYFH